MNCTFFLKKPDSDGIARVHMFVSINGQPGFFSTKVRVLASAWNQDRQSVDAKQIGYREINGVLAERKAQMVQVFKDLDYEKIKATRSLVRARYNRLINHEPAPTENDVLQPRQLTFYEFMDAYVEERRSTRAKGYLRKFKPLKAWLMSFNPELNWKDITMKFYNDYLTYLIEDGDLENNYISGHVKKIKTLMRAASRDPRARDQVLSIDFEMFKDPYVDPKPIWLDWENELQLLENLTPLEEDEIYRQEFLFRCYTGLRHSDLFNAHGANFIHRGDDVYIDFTSIKTRADQNLRLSRKAVEILKAWDFKPPRLYIDKCNLAIKRLCRAAGVKTMTEKVRFSGSKRKVEVKEKWELIATHVARRTFGRRWMENGGTLSLLSLYYGHSTERMTSKYIGWHTSEVNEQVIRVID